MGGTVVGGHPYIGSIVLAELIVLVAVELADALEMMVVEAGEKVFVVVLASILAPKCYEMDYGVLIRLKRIYNF